MIPNMLIIALLLMPEEPVTAEQWDYGTPLEIIADDGYTTSMEAAE